MLYRLNFEAKRRQGMRAYYTAAIQIFVQHGFPPFEIITCLWNVLGHVREEKQRLLVLAKLKGLLSERGMIFLDVSHRYNAAAYGWTKTAWRIAHDFFLRSDKHGDVIVSWEVDGRTIRTRGRVFRQAEMKKLFRTAGLKIVGKWVVSYETGAECRLSTSGHLLYQLAVA